MQRAEKIGIMKRDKIDIQQVLEHWRIVRMLGELEQSSAKVVTAERCQKYIVWLDGALRVAAGEPAAQ